MVLFRLCGNMGLTNMLTSAFSLSLSFSKSLILLKGVERVSYCNSSTAEEPNGLKCIWRNRLVFFCFQFVFWLKQTNLSKSWIMNRYCCQRLVLLLNSTEVGSRNIQTPFTACLKFNVFPAFSILTKVWAFIFKWQHGICDSVSSSNFQSVVVFC